MDIPVKTGLLYIRKRSSSPYISYFNVYNRLCQIFCCPHANIIAYDMCISEVGCSRVAILAAIDQAMTDGVDVINYSIGGPPTAPWSDPVALAFVNARAADIFVAVSAGNEGEFGLGIVSSPANAPRLTAVAASTHGRDFDPKSLVAVSDRPITMIADTHCIMAQVVASEAPDVDVWMYLDGSYFGRPNMYPPNGMVEHYETIECQRTTNFEHATPGFLDRCAVYTGSEGADP